MLPENYRRPRSPRQERASVLTPEFADKLGNVARTLPQDTRLIDLIVRGDETYRKSQPEDHQPPIKWETVFKTLSPVQKRVLNQVIDRLTRRGIGSIEDLQRLSTNDLLDTPFAVGGRFNPRTCEFVGTVFGLSLNGGRAEKLEEL